MHPSNVYKEPAATLFSLALLLTLFTCILWARAAHAQPVNAGEEPAGGPIVYNLIPAEGAIVEPDQLGRAGATIETQRHAGVAWAAIFVDGHRRPSALMGATSYYQSISADIGGLEPGRHTLRVIAIDAEGRVGGYTWTFTVGSLEPAGMASAAVVSGTAGDDDLKGTGAQDTLFGKEGIDTLNGRGANDALFGQADDDLFVDTSGDDLLRGGSGDDLFAGNPGEDAVHAGRGADLILDDLGEDFLSGSRGDDMISVAGFGPGPPKLLEESDAIVCGGGLDEVDAHPSDVVANDCEEINLVPAPSF